MAKERGEEKDAKKHRGIYQRGRIWWIKYYRNGKPYYESSKSDRVTKALRLLKKREGEIAKGELPGIYFDKVRFKDLADSLLRDYRINAKKNLSKVETYVRMLSGFFGEVRVPDITTERIQEFIEKRKKDGLENSSVNRELSALKRMFTLGSRARKVNQIPFVPMLKESNTRKGFFEHNEFLALKSALPPYLKALVTFAYHTGWRESEILGLRWDQVDLDNKTVRLDPGETKNEEGRTLFLNDELFHEMKVLQAKRDPRCPLVFQREGQRIKRFTRAWKTACIRAGLSEPLRDAAGNIVKTRKKDAEGKVIEKTIEIPTKIFHDFRRTAVRNMVRSGIPERVAMAISGHRTRSVFERYNIVSQKDLQEAARKQEGYLLRQNGYNLVTVEPKNPVFEDDASSNLLNSLNAPVAQVDRARDS
jgi:integrase